MNMRRSWRWMWARRVVRWWVCNGGGLARRVVGEGSMVLDVSGGGKWGRESGMWRFRGLVGRE